MDNHNFKKGDTIRCVNANGYPNLTEGEEYVVESVNKGTKLIRVAGKSCFTTRFVAVAIAPLTFPTKTKDIVLTMDSNGVAVITCGCFTGTLSEAYAEARRPNRTHYSDTLNYVAKVIEWKGLLKSRPITPQTGEIWFSEFMKADYLVVEYDGKHIWIDHKTGEAKGTYDIGELPTWKMKRIRKALT